MSPTCLQLQSPARIRVLKLKHPALLNTLPLTPTIKRIGQLRQNCHSGITPSVGESFVADECNPFQNAPRQWCNILSPTHK